MSEGQCCRTCEGHTVRNGCIYGMSGPCLPVDCCDRWRPVIENEVTRLRAECASLKALLAAMQEKTCETCINKHAATTSVICPRNGDSTCRALCSLSQCIDEDFKYWETKI